MGCREKIPHHLLPMGGRPRDVGASWLGARSFKPILFFQVVSQRCAGHTEG